MVDMVHLWQDTGYYLLSRGAIPKDRHSLSFVLDSGAPLRCVDNNPLEFVKFRNCWAEGLIRPPLGADKEVRVVDDNFTSGNVLGSNFPLEAMLNPPRTYDPVPKSEMVVEAKLLANVFVVFLDFAAFTIVLRPFRVGRKFKF